MSFSESICQEYERVVEKINHVCDETSVRYAFVTDTHFDTKQSVGNEELVKNTVEIIRKLGQEGYIDFVVHGGDITTGWKDGAACKHNTSTVSDMFLDFPVPVIFTIGNHDFNYNPETVKKEHIDFSSKDVNGKNPEVLDHEIWYELTQKKLRRDSYVYGDDSVETLYFYVDFPERKTRAVCLQAFYCTDKEKQLRFVAEKVLTQKEKDWKYLFFAHAPLDVRYESSGMHHVCPAADDIKLLISALNNRITAKTSIGDFDFSDFESNAVVYNCGHVHNSYAEYVEDLKMIHAATGQTGCVGSGEFNVVTPDDNSTNRHKLENTDANRYLFDIVSVSPTKYNRIRFGNGCDKTLEIK